jgi:hypothetical protein
VPCPIENEPLVLRVGQGDGVFFLGDVNQNFYRALAIAAAAYEQFFSPVAVFETVKDDEILFAYIVDNAPNLALIGKMLAVPQLRSREWRAIAKR